MSMMWNAARFACKFAEQGGAAVSIQLLRAHAQAAFIDITAARRAAGIHLLSQKLILGFV